MKIRYLWSELNELLDRCNGSVYIVNLDVFRHNLRTLLTALRSNYRNTSLGYSYKTNYLPLLCAEADRLGLYAEVVSGMEYEIARHLGVPPNRIIFNGPVKSASELTSAFEGDTLVNVDSLCELSLIADLLARRPDLHASIGLRCSLEMRWGSRSTRFGLSDANGDLQRAVDRVRSIPNATLCGLHSHTSSARSIEAFRERAARIVELARTIFPDQPPQFLNLGGGLSGPMPASLRQQFGRECYSYDEFASAVASVMAAEYGADGHTELILEPGVAVVGNAVEYACRVEAIKTMPACSFVITSGAVDHLKILPNSINQPLSVLTSGSREHGQHDGVFDVVGFTCLEHDLMYQGYEGSINVGDILLFSHVGAYSLVTAASFIRPVPPVVLQTGEGKWRTVKRQSSVEELLSQFEW